MADRLLDAMARSASRLYGGEAVAELEHALQCAELARAAGADEDLQLACLLHDVGRYAVDPSLVFDTDEPSCAGPHARGHHEVGAELIAPWVPEPDYFDRLSTASRHALRLQGGVMTAVEVARLAVHPWLPDALALRRWDDSAKVVGKATRPLSAWAPLIRRCFDR